MVVMTHDAKPMSNFRLFCSIHFLPEANHAHAFLLLYAGQDSLSRHRDDLQLDFVVKIEIAAAFGSPNY